MWTVDFGQWWCVSGGSWMVTSVPSGEGSYWLRGWGPGGAVHEVSVPFAMDLKLLWKLNSIFFKAYWIFLKFIYYLFLAVLGLRFCARAFSSCGERGPLFIAVRGPLTVTASLVAEHKLQTRRLSSCGSRAWLLRGMWDLPRPGLEPVSPALAGRFSTTAPPGKPWRNLFNYTHKYVSY